jgi:hypothetical protein
VPGGQLGQGEDRATGAVRYCGCPVHRAHRHGIYIRRDSGKRTTRAPAAAAARIAIPFRTRRLLFSLLELEDRTRRLAVMALRIRLLQD